MTTKSVIQKVFYPTTKKLLIKWYHWIAGVGKSTKIAKKYFIDNPDLRVCYLTHSHKQAENFIELVHKNSQTLISIHHLKGVTQHCRITDPYIQKRIKQLINAGFHGAKACSIMKRFGLCPQKGICKADIGKDVKKIVSVVDMLPFLIGQPLNVLILDDPVLEKAQPLLSYFDTNMHYILGKKIFLGNQLSEPEIETPIHLEDLKTIQKHCDSITIGHHILMKLKINHLRKDTYGLERFLDKFPDLQSEPMFVKIGKRLKKEQRMNTFWYNFHRLQIPYWKHLLGVYGEKAKDFQFISYPLIFDFFRYLKQHPKTLGVFSAASSAYYKTFLTKLADRYAREFGALPTFDPVPVPSGSHLGRQGTIYQYYRRTPRDTKYSAQFWTNPKSVEKLITEIVPSLYSIIIKYTDWKNVSHGWITKYRANTKINGKWLTIPVKEQVLDLAKNELRLKDVNSLHFGNFAGSNKLEDSDMITVFSTFYPNVDEAIEMCQALFPDEPIINSKVWDNEKDRDGNKAYRYENQTLQDFMLYLQENTMYQAVHRARMKEKRDIITKKVIHVPPDILVFGLLPEKVNLEYDVRPITIRHHSNGEAYPEFGYPIWEDKLFEYFKQRNINEMDKDEAFIYLTNNGYYDKTDRSFRREANKSHYFDYDTMKCDKKKRGRRRTVLRLKMPL